MLADARDRLSGIRLESDLIHDLQSVWSPYCKKSLTFRGVNRDPGVNFQISSYWEFESSSESPASLTSRPLVESREKNSLSFSETNVSPYTLNREVVRISRRADRREENREHRLFHRIHPGATRNVLWSNYTMGFWWGSGGLRKLRIDSVTLARFINESSFRVCHGLFQGEESWNSFRKINVESKLPKSTTINRL